MAMASKVVDRLIADRHGRFHFGSFVRCSVERQAKNKETGKMEWVGTGGGMLDKFAKTGFGSHVVRKCAERFLGDLTAKVKLVIMFGTGTKLGYVTEARRIFEAIRPGRWQTINDVAYTDGHLHLDNWLGVKPDKRGKLGVMAREAVVGALANCRNRQTESQQR